MDCFWETYVTQKIAIRSATILLAILSFSVGLGITQSQEKPQVRSPITVGHNPPLRVFAAVLPQIKAKSHVPILLPSELPQPIAKAKHAVIGTAETDKYGIALYFEREPDGGYFGFAASFGGVGKPNFRPQELPNVEPVNLTHHLHGFFSAVSCSGSCAPANLWWEQNGGLYHIQLMLNVNLSDQAQENAIVAVANSAILGGPR